MFRQFNLHTGLVLRVNGAADDRETNQNIWWFWLFGKLLFLYFLVSWHINCGCYLNIVLSLEAAGSVGIMTAFLEALEINAWGRMCCCFVTETYLSASHRGGISICKTEKETRMYRTDFWILWEKARVGCFKRTAHSFLFLSNISSVCGCNSICLTIHSFTHWRTFGSYLV